MPIAQNVSTNQPKPATQYVLPNEATPVPLASVYVGPTDGLPNSGWIPILMLLVGLLITILLLVTLHTHLANPISLTPPLPPSSSGVAAHENYAASPSLLSPSKWLSYQSAEGWGIEYPSDMALTLKDTASTMSPTTIVTQVTLVGRNSQISIRTEPNPKNLSVYNWLGPISKTFNGPQERIDIAGRQSLIWYSSQVVNAMDVFYPLQNNQMLWAVAWTLNQPRPTHETRMLLLTILGSLSVPKP